MKRIVAAAAALTLALLLSAARCDPQSPPAPVATSAAAPSAEKIKTLCDFFYTRPHEVLLTAAGEGNVSTFRTARGVPSELSEVARQYYAGQALSSPITPERRTELDKRYAAVINACQRAGWKAP